MTFSPFDLVEDFKNMKCELLVIGCKAFLSRHYLWENILHDG